MSVEHAITEIKNLIEAKDPFDSADPKDVAKREKKKADIEATAKTSFATLSLFRAEINNEDHGGVSPATLGSALDSLEQGYEPYDNFNSELAGREIDNLIRMFGSDYELDNFYARISDVLPRMNEDRGRYPKGHVPHNKGKPHPYGKETEFQAGPGHTGDKHPTWGGGVQTPKNDCTHVWSGTNKRLRRPHKVWIEHNGPIPAGMVLFHRDGDRYNDDLSNLELITRGELARRNRKNRTARKIPEARATKMPSSKELINMYDSIKSDLQSITDMIGVIDLPRRGTSVEVDDERRSLNHLFSLVVNAGNQADYLFKRHKRILNKGEPK